MTIVEIRCPRCGAQCSLKDKTTSEYHCEHCGANFRFMDSTTKTIIQDTRAHHCPICGRPVKIEEATSVWNAGKNTFALIAYNNWVVSLFAKNVFDRNG